MWFWRKVCFAAAGRTMHKRIKVCRQAFPEKLVCHIEYIGRKRLALNGASAFGLRLKAKVGRSGGGGARNAGHIDSCKLISFHDDRHLFHSIGESRRHMRIYGDQHGDVSVEEKTLAAFYCGIELIAPAGPSSGWFRKLYHQTPPAWTLPLIKNYDSTRGEMKEAKLPIFSGKGAHRGKGSELCSMGVGKIGAGEIFRHLSISG